MCSEMSKVSERQVLPTNVKPTHYDLTLQPDFETFTFQGRVKVNLEVKDDSKVIVVNTFTIKIHSASLASTGLKTETTQKAVDIACDEDKRVSTLTFEESVPANSKAVLDIHFEGILNDEMAGFYRSKYSADGQTRYLATTQFEATDARRAFPCWDEPSLKATFDVTLIVPAEMTALSNMNVISEEPVTKAGGLGKTTGKVEGKTEGETEGKTEGDTSAKALKEVKYATTPLMSTYLLAFVVGSLDYIEAYTSGEHNGKPIQARVYTTPGESEKGRHALNVCVKALEYFAEVFKEPYPLPKLDMVAIPDFEAGAMENWGLVTYRVTALLFDEKNSSALLKKSTAYTVCHELAHQWFGNLVTMEWWDHLWLNEGFATWVGWLAVDHVFPEWDVWTSFVSEDAPRAFDLDGLRSSHPIEVAVNDPAEIHQIFDAISYYKGASVIRMLSAWLGVKVFLGGVQRYLNRHKFGNASTNDLWKALSEVAGKDVSEFMTLWTRHVGYPVLSVEKNAADKISIKQSRYLSTGDLKDEEDSTAWWAPLNILTPGNEKSFTLTKKSEEFDIDSDEPFKLNAGQTAVYRVNYPPEVIKTLSIEIRKGDDGLLKNATDRIGLLADAGNLCISGEQTTAAFLELAQSFKNEKNYFVWSQLSSHFSNILSTWYEQPDDIRDGIKAVRRSLFAPIAHQLGWEYKESDDYLTNNLRTLALGNAGRSNDPETVHEAKKRFTEFINGKTEALHPNIRRSVYSIVLSTAKEGEETEIWNAIFKLFEDEKLPADQRLTALAALASTKNKVLIKQYLDLLFSEDEKVRTADSIYIFRSLADNPQARDQLWEYFTEHYDELHTKMARSLSLFAAAVRSSVGGFVSLKKIEKVEAFFADKNTKEYTRALDQALEQAKVNAKWVERDHKSVEKWVSAWTEKQ